MHLADTFIQSDLQCIQVIHLLSMCVPWDSNPQPFVLLCSALPTEPQEHYNISRLRVKYYMKSDYTVSWKKSRVCKSWP